MYSKKDEVLNFQKWSYIAEALKIYRQKAMSLEYEILRFMAIIWFCSSLRTKLLTKSKRFSPMK